jgi:hypothetical protein
MSISTHGTNAAQLEHPHDKPLSLAMQDLSQRPVAKHYQQFLSQCGSINMSLKVICYLLRYRIYLNPHSPLASSWQALETSCLEGRMLTGMWRYIDMHKAVSELLHRAETSTIPKLVILAVTLFSILLRAVGQLSGDLMYTQKYLAAHWSFPRLQWHYRFSKSLAQTLASVLDCRTLRKHLSDERMDSEERRKKVLLTLLALLRNVCDMVCYFQWVTWYHPPKTLELSCGAVSGAVGAYFCWLSSGETVSSPK